MYYKYLKFKVFYTFLLSSGEEKSTTKLFEIDRETGKLIDEKIFCKKFYVENHSFIVIVKFY